MKKTILVILFLGLLVAPLWAGEHLEFTAKGKIPVSITGTITELGRNYLEILDEDDTSHVKRLTYFGKGQFKVGERVRVWFDPRFWVIEQIKPMTPVEYHAQGQNTGYIYKK